ncbi:MAG: HAD family hydrolase [Sulfuricurvum sp.]
MKTIILFDLDGTLIDSTEAILESFHHALQTHQTHLNITDEMITSLIGHPLDVMFSGVGIPKPLVNIHVETYKLYYREISCLKTVLLPNAQKALEEASRFARLGIVTTKTGKYSQELMEYFGVMDYFEVLIGREHVQNPKPHPEPIFKALEEMNVNEESVWMIGDTRLDIEASKKAGINPLGVTSGYDNEEELRVLTDFILPDVLEAVRFIANIGDCNTLA